MRGSRVALAGDLSSITVRTHIILGDDLIVFVASRFGSCNSNYVGRRFVGSCIAVPLYIREYRATSGNRFMSDNAYAVIRLGLDCLIIA